MAHEHEGDSEASHIVAEGTSVVKVICYIPVEHWLVLRLG